MRAIVLVLVTVLASSSAVSTPDDTPEATVARFYAAIADGDAERALAQWSPAAPAFPAFGRQLRGVLRVHCIAMKGIAVTPLTTSDNRVVAGVVALVAHGTRAAEPESVTLTLGREGGGWRIVDRAVQEDALGDELSAARSD